MARDTGGSALPEYKDGYYIPRIVPEEDVRAFLRYPKPRRGLGDKPAIIVVDMTYHFVEDKYPWGFSKTGKPCVEAIKRLLEAARELRIPIFYTRRDRRAESIELIAPRALADSDSASAKVTRETDTLGYEIVREIAPQKGDIVIEKAAPSAFLGTPLVALLNRIKIDTVIVTGMVTSGCMRATAVDAFAYRYRVIIPVECTADRSQISHEVSLFDLSMKYAHVLPLDELIQMLRARVSFGKNP